MRKKHKNTIYLTLLLCLLTGLLTTCAYPLNSLNTSNPLNTWIKASAGSEIRYEHWVSADQNNDTVIITRFDSSRIHLSVEYQPHQPLSLGAWMKQTGALAIINGGYFDEHNQAEALTISDNNIYGADYGTFGGLLASDAQGKIILHWLHQQPYDPATDQLAQATESAPMLVVDGQDIHDQFAGNTQTNRRTVVAIDKQGRLLFIVSPQHAFTLQEMAIQLAHSDLAIQSALNLDGGASTGLYINSATQKVSVDAFVPLPLVIIVKQV